MIEALAFAVVLAAGLFLRVPGGGAILAAARVRWMVAQAGAEWQRGGPWTGLPDRPETAVCFEEASLMAGDKASAERVTQIISLLRPERPRRIPTSLAAAAASGDLERMQLFLDRGASVDERTAGQSTPLAAACAHGQKEAVRWLIAHGAQIDMPDDIHNPITSALGKGNCEIAALLLDAGLPIERAAWGVTAASALGRLDMLRWLVGRGIDLDRSYPRLGLLRERALRDARKDGGEEVVRFLKGELDPGPPPADPPPTPPLHRELPRSAPADRPRLLQEALDLIRAAGKSAANWNAAGPAAGPQRQGLLSFAAAAGIVDIVTALLDAGAPPDTDPDGTPPPLTAAAGEAQTEVARLLLQRGALPNGRDGKSWLPLVGAVQSGDPGMVRILLEAGANPKAKPAGGRKLVEYVGGPYAQEIRTLLEQSPGVKGAGKKGRG
ncbi:MAG: ankyrin repeat domain-containing protein [Lysobacter sp.]|nr:ankyrin repeat domain-containing protein [Lysobacter sp.]